MTHLCAICSGSRRMFDTTVAAESDGNFDCLIHRSQSSFLLESAESQRDPEIWYPKNDRYCRRSTLSDSEQMVAIKNLSTTNFKVLTFDQLRSMNIKYHQLYNWYAPMDIIEDYISGVENGSFYNCSTTLSFGSTCEYTFDSSDDLEDLLNKRFYAKRNLPLNLSLFTNGTCYEMIDANCESILCLDWREICDGKIDCKNGFDEHRCQELEMNECNSLTEQRCYDGQCIDDIETIWTNRQECSKHTEADKHMFIKCYLTTGESCENEKCGWLEFSCGDGYCYDGPIINDSQSCPTQRDKRYLDKMSSSSSFILFSHLHIIYNDTEPNSICYNQTLCPYIYSKNLPITKYTFDGLPCHAFETFSNETYSNFNEMIVSVKRFVSFCSLLPSNYNNPNNICPMYQCDGGGKCLSFYRLMDDIKDCPNGDDEYNTHVCSSDHPGRFGCDNGTKCISQKLLFDGVNDCNDETDESIIRAALIKCPNPFSMNCPFYKGSSIVYRLTFDQICNGLIEYIADANNNTDESDCLTKEWSCNTYQSKCDQLWNCPDGHDELECNTMTISSHYCNNTEHFCLDISSGDRKCLPTINVNDGIIDCIGSFDEREFCRSKYPYESFYRYRCRNSMKCISSTSICDCKPDCPEEDDETTACHWWYDEKNPLRTCDRYSSASCEFHREEWFDIRDDIFCGLDDRRSNIFWKYHQTGEYSSMITENHIERRSFKYFDQFIIWSCNRGIYARSTKFSSGFVCLCPEYYYGDRCQYQRKRIKVILQIQMKSSFNYQVSAFKFLVLLVYKNKTSTIIVSHDQFLYIPRIKCLPKFYILLLYPIHKSYRFLTNHSIDIHVFDTDTLEHRYSRNYPLSFEFLPVQTIVKRVLVPETQMDAESKQVSLSYTGCNSCSNTSLCLGHDVSLARDICVCPSNYVGRRCLIPFNLCTNKTCNGHGTCQSLSTNQDPPGLVLCSCHLGWYGSKCQYSSAHVNVSFDRDVTFLSSNMAFLHLVNALNYDFLDEIRHLIYFHRFSGSRFNLTFMLNNTDKILDVGFIQFYEDEDKFEYYLLFSRKLNEKSIHEISIEVKSSHRCRSVKELFDNNIFVQPIMRRVKNYQRPCKHFQEKLLCFYDDYLMCLCLTDNQTYCFNFQTNLDICDKKDCHGRGMCVKDDEKCSFNSQCICESCAYGRFCEFSTSGYTLSLDGIIGSHIMLTAIRFSDQSNVILTSVSIIIVVVIIGIILNVLSIFTFIQRETQEVGCGLYLLVSSIIGLLTMITLVCKTIFLLNGDQSDVACSIVEFLLNWCPTSCKWLNTGVAVERIIAVKRQTQYSRVKSKLFEDIR